MPCRAHSFSALECLCEALCLLSSSLWKARGNGRQQRPLSLLEEAAGRCPGEGPLPRAKWRGRESPAPPASLPTRSLLLTTLLASACSSLTSFDCSNNKGRSLPEPRRQPQCERQARHAPGGCCKGFPGSKSLPRFLAAMAHLRRLKTLRALPSAPRCCGSIPSCRCSRCSVGAGERP